MRALRLQLPVVTVFALSAILAEASPPPLPDPGQLGPYAVGFTSFVVTDPSRETDIGPRPIPVSVWYPVDRRTIDESTPGAIYKLDPIQGPETPEPITTPETAPMPTTTSSQWEAFGLDRAYQEPRHSSRGPFPLLMLSPGLGSFSANFIYLGTRLASHGFVVAATIHYGDGALLWDPVTHLATAAQERGRDVSFALTQILTRNAVHGDLLHGLIRPDKIAAAGHSYGGYAAMTLAGGDDLACDVFQDPPLVDWFGEPPASSCVAAPPDPRIKAIVSLDGSSWVLLWHELHRVRVPSLFLGEEWDMQQDLNARPHAAFSGFPNLRVDVLRSAHLPSFTNICEWVRLMGELGWLLPETRDAYLSIAECDASYLINPAEAQRLITKYMVAFLKVNLVGDLRYAPLLVPPFANEREPNLGFVATELPWLGIPAEERDCCFGYFLHARSPERARADKNPWSPCCNLEGGQCRAAAARRGEAAQPSLLPGPFRSKLTPGPDW